MKKVASFLISEAGRIVIGLVFFITAFILDALSVEILPLIFYLVALLAAGIAVFIDAVRGIIRGDLLDEKFLMSIASIGAMIVGEYSEGVAVMLFFLVGEYFEHKAVSKSRKSIRALMDIRPDEATVVKDGVEISVDADEVEPGETIVIRAGERVPLDSVVISGDADVDTSAITGESLPRRVSVGSEIDSGFVVLNGVIYAKALRSAEKSRASRILELVENANERKSKTENFITKFSHFYTPTVVILAVLIATVLPLFKVMNFETGVYRALIFLVISCPCALVISVPMAFFGGIGSAASKGILYKGGNTFSSLAKADSFAFDKTGTLTKGEFKISRVAPVAVSESELLYYAASAEHGSNHPIAECIKYAVSVKAIPKEMREFAGKGILSVVDGCEILVGSARLLSDFSVEIPEIKLLPTDILVAKDGKFIGSISISDAVKDEAREAIESLYSLGAKRVVMLSGDKREKAEAVGSEVGISEIYSELLPENKYEKLTEIIENSRNTVFVGDGINDAPAIALADVGVAMGERGADSAIESADVVIMSDNLAKLPSAIRIARKTVRIASENIIFALGVKIAVMILGAFGFANMWLAVFADVGVAALAILNSMRTLGGK